MTTNDFKQKVSQIKGKSSAEVLDYLSQYEAYVCQNYEGFASEEPVCILYQLVETKERKETEEAVPLFQVSQSGFEALLEKLLSEQKREETFSDMIVRLMREKKRTAPQVYRAAGIDAKHFSKIIGRRDYQPKKETVLAFAIAFHLNLDETEKLLKKAGYAFSSSSMFDVTVKFFIEKKCYNRETIDFLMEGFSLPLLPQNWTV